jgi:hypothetical protein
LAEQVGVKAPGKANKAMVLPAEALATSTGLGPMLQPLPSTSTNSVNVTAGMVSPTLIMVIPLKMVLKSDWKGMHLINTPTKKNDPLL